jgi:hypothetical protein
MFRLSLADCPLIAILNSKRDMSGEENMVLSHIQASGSEGSGLHDRQNLHR